MFASAFVALTLATNSPWEAALERSAVVFDRPNDYLRFTGDRTLLPHVAKWLRSQTELYLQLCTREADGQWHVRCTNVNESWLKADDSIVDLLAARYCFAQTVPGGTFVVHPDLGV